MCKAHQVRSNFGNWDVEKVYAVVARSTFRSQKCKKLRGTEHFWTFRCRFVWQAQGIVNLVKVRKTWRFCRSFNYNHHYTTLHYTTFHCTTLQLQLQLHYTTLITPHYSTLHFTSRHCTQLHYTTTTTTLHYTTLITLHYTTVHYTPPNYTTLTTTTTTLHYTNYTTLHYTPLHCAQLHYTTLQLQVQLHCATLH